MKVVAVTKSKIVKPSIRGFKVHNFLWQEFGNKDLNLRDYDGVILDLTEVVDGAAEINWESVNEALNFDVTKDVLVSDSSFIILVGNPFINIGDSKISELLGVKLNHIEGKGDSIQKTKYFEKSKYKNYLDSIKTYDYTFDQPRAVPSVERVADRLNFEHAVDDISYLINRAGKIIAARFKPVIYKTDYYGSRTRVQPLFYGELILLPSSKLDASETVRLLLEANKDSEGDNTRPLWLDSMQVAGEDEINAKISEVQERIDNDTAEKDVLLLRRENLRRPLEVLYKSDKPLESSIKDLLRSVGATIIEPESDDKVEFYITHDELKFVVEVKSTINENIDQKGLRQVLDWQNDAFDLTGDEYKPLVIASVQYDKPIDSRNSEVVPSNLVDYSTKKSIAVITVLDLFKVCQDIVRGDRDVGFLLDQLSNLSGLYEYNPPKIAEPDKEK